MYPFVSATFTSLCHSTLRTFQPWTCSMIAASRAMDALVRRYKSRSASATSKGVRWIRVHAFSRLSSLFCAGTIRHDPTAVCPCHDRSRNAAVDSNRIIMSDQDESIEQFGRPADMNRAIWTKTGFCKGQISSAAQFAVQIPRSPFGRDTTPTSFMCSSKNVTFIDPLDRARHRHC